MGFSFHMRPEATRGAAETVAQIAAGDFLTIARILRPQGRRGEVAAEIFTDFPARFERLQSALLEAPGQAPRPVTVEYAWPHKGRVILKLSGIDSIESASHLRGLHLFIPWEQRTPLPPHHYYLWELRGCRVIWERQGKEIGTVTDVELTGGAALLHVARREGIGEVLIPLAQEICTRIDIASKTIVIDPPEDLLDLNS
ncbi:MAG: ribosome maturation factor RimM [Acidobacteriia bacterium]|nr:ribosome maturation factor RimM [Terriglobia bacterium]